MTCPNHRSECPDCGKPLYPDLVHTCSPQANPCRKYCRVEEFTKQIGYLEADLEVCRTYARNLHGQLEQQRRPLGQQQIDDIWQRYMHGKLSNFTQIVRAVEAAHGITPRYTNEALEGSEL